MVQALAILAIPIDVIFVVKEIEVMYGSYDVLIVPVRVGVVRLI